VRLEGRTVVVTGAGSGIGRGVACAVAEKGGRVVAADIDRAAAEETVQEVEGLGGEALARRLDVTDETAVGRAIEATIERFAALDGWVNNAGVLRMGAALDGGDEWSAQFEVNARAVMTCSRLAARAMIERGGGGAIVNVASNAGKVGYPHMAAYNASKAAVISLTRSLAAEWAEHGVNVNAVCPGGVETPMLAEVARWLGEREGVDPGELLPMMRPAQLARHIQPIEVGRVVTFLLSEEAAIIRGQSINVDGGETPY
jgi:NAD(P)-dependent dehydrogenase (short-subunit alcohol dehydrogenase family)